MPCFRAHAWMLFVKPECIMQLAAYSLGSVYTQNRKSNESPDIFGDNRKIEGESEDSKREEERESDVDIYGSKALCDLC